MANSGLSDSDFYGSDSSDEDLRDMDEEVQMLFQCVVAATNVHICSTLMNGKKVANNR
jgi:hypothetical protein